MNGVMPGLLAAAWAFPSLVYPRDRRAHAFSLLLIVTTLLMTVQVSSFTLRFSLPQPPLPAMRMTAARIKSAPAPMKINLRFISLTKTPLRVHLYKLFCRPPNDRAAPALFHVLKKNPRCFSLMGFPSRSSTCIMSSQTFRFSDGDWFRNR